MTHRLVVMDAYVSDRCGVEAAHVFAPGPSNASPPYCPDDNQRCECGAVTWKESVEMARKKIQALWIRFVIGGV
jgi:hypothetical protein